MDAAFGFLPFGIRLDCSVLLGCGAVRGAMGTVTLVLMAEMEERGTAGYRSPTTPQQAITGLPALPMDLSWA